jgi:uncharacterized protein YhdP
LHRLVLRPLLVVLTLIMLSVALVQGVGRLGFAVLDELELAVNQWLSAQHVRVIGLSGSWRLLNPVIHVDEVEFPAGALAGVTVEFDWLESLVRNRLVTRRLAIDQGQVELEPDGSGGWQLVGVASGGDLDLSGLLYQSDQLQVATQVLLRDDSGETVAGYSLNYLGINRGGRHRHQLLVVDDRACSARCGGRFELEAREGLWPVWQEKLTVSGQVDGLEIPAAISGSNKITIAQLAGVWQRDEQGSGGNVSVHLQDIQLPGEISLSVQLAGRLAGTQDTQHGVIEEFRWTYQQEDPPEVAGTPSNTWELPEFRVEVGPSSAEVWAGSMDLALAAQFLEGALAGIELPSRWLRELNLDATALNVRGRLDWPSWEIGLAATLADLEIDGYKGAPYLRGAAGELIAYRRGAQFNLNGQNMVAQFPATFRDRWTLNYVQGVVQMWFKEGYIGLRGPSVRLRSPTHRASGQFAITRPSDRREERLTLLVDLEDLELEQARTYVPYTVSEGLRDWLQSGPRAGVFVQPRLGYHGHVHPRPGELSRRVEITSGLRDATVRYDAEWPEITDLFGRLVVAGSTTRVEVSQATTAGAQLLSGSRVTLRNNAAHADVKLVAEAPTDQILNFVRDTPLRDSLTFVEPGWTGAGTLLLSGGLHIPLNVDDAQEQLGVDLSVGFRQADLAMPDVRLAFAGLQGEVRYRYPNSLQGSGITGTTFGSPTLISARDEDSSMVLRVEGSATQEHVYHVLEMEDPGVALGRVDFVADLFMPASDDDVTRLDVTTDMVGVALALPGEFFKTAEVARPLDVSVDFLDDYQRVSFNHASALGWLHINDRPVRGAIGFNLAPPDLGPGADYLLLAGQVDGFALDAVIPDDGGTGEVLLPVKLANVRVGVIDVEDMQITDAILNGDITTEGFAINVASAMLGADFRLHGEGPLLADVAYIALPEPEDGDADPLHVSMIPDLPQAHVVVRSLRVGDFDYGRWRFDVAPGQDGVSFVDLDADLHGLHIQAPDGVLWNAQEDRSYFVGEVQVGDIAEVLPHWDYAPSLETESGLFTGAVSWAGSPANVDLLRLVGTAKIRAVNGRFVDVESGGGALKIFSLMNFNTIAKRMRGDFSDVNRKGLVFDKLKATIGFDEGKLEFVESLKVTGTGSKFEVGGRVNLIEGTLDNEMVVTLPVNRSLPWYGVYLALANPLAGAGVIVGERVLRKPIEAFSSAKYQVSGTIDEPVVNLVNVFDTSMRQTRPNKAPATVEGVLEAEHNAAEVGDDQERSEI